MFGAAVPILCPWDDKHGGKSPLAKDYREETERFLVELLTSYMSASCCLGENMRKICETDHMFKSLYIFYYLQLNTFQLK